MWNSTYLVEFASVLMRFITHESLLQDGQTTDTQCLFELISLLT